MNRIHKITTRQAAARFRVSHETLMDFIRKHNFKVTRGDMLGGKVHYANLKKEWDKK